MIFKLLKRKPPVRQEEYFYQNEGYCPSCDSNVIFRSKESWLRDHYRCSNCKSWPRERALAVAIEKYYPDWKQLLIHESSPCDRGTSIKLKNHCPGYSFSEYAEENIESLTFPDNSFDLFITQDVMEHVFDPADAFKEIARVLKNGGAHIFTVPLVNKEKPSTVWATRNADGTPNFLQASEYHGPFPVTMHWGYDICEFIHRISGLHTTIFLMEIPKLGIEAEYLEVLITHKP